MLKRTFNIRFIVSLFIVLSLSISITYASEDNATDTKAVILKDFNNELPNVVQQYISAINNKDWELFVKSLAPEIQKDYSGFPS